MKTKRITGRQWEVHDEEVVKGLDEIIEQFESRVPLQDLAMIMDGIDCTPYTFAYNQELQGELKRYCKRHGL